MRFDVAASNDGTSELGAHAQGTHWHSILGDRV